MSGEGVDRQQALHEAVETAAALDDGAVLVGWIVLWETATVDGRGECGHMYGPREMSTWRALGLVEWARRFTLHPDLEDDE